MIHIPFRLLPGGRAPVKATEGASGFDLCARIDEVANDSDLDAGAAPLFRIPPARSRQLWLREGPFHAPAVKIPLGVSFAIPPGFEGQLRLRSSSGLKSLVIPNGLGTIDSDYRGEVCMILLNLSGEDVVIRDGDRLAQIVFQRVPEVALVEVDALDETARGAGGFGSSGTGPLVRSQSAYFDDVRDLPAKIVERPAWEKAGFMRASLVGAHEAARTQPPSTGLLTRAPVITPEQARAGPPPPCPACGGYFGCVRSCRNYGLAGRAAIGSADEQDAWIDREVAYRRTIDRPPHQPDMFQSDGDEGAPLGDPDE